MRPKVWTLLLLIAVCGCEAKPKPTPLTKKDPWPAGTVLVSRNRDESENTSPGYWNHLAIYIGDYRVVESQADRGVILTKTVDYNARNYDWHPLYPINLNVGKVAAEKAKTLVGLPYRAASSLTATDRHPEQGLNCVSVVRLSYVSGTGEPLPTLHKPDDIEALTGLFTKQNPLESK